MPFLRDRFRPATAGALTGFLAGAAALGVVHGLEPGAVAHLVEGGAAQRGVALEVSMAIAYGTAGACGALVGAAFASITQRLRKLVPLLVWALVFFGSVTMLALALSRTYGHGAGVAMAPAILAASGAFGFIVAFQLPLRRRG